MLLSYSFLQSSTPFELTEAETEYSVNVVKHIYDGHVVLQYNCTNTIPEQLLEEVSNFFHVICLQYVLFFSVSAFLNSSIPGRGVC